MIQPVLLCRLLVVSSMRIIGTFDDAARLAAGHQLKELQNGPPSVTMLGPEASSLDILASQASLTSVKASDGPSLVVFSGGTAFNSVAGDCHLLECF